MMLWNTKDRKSPTRQRRRLMTLLRPLAFALAIEACSDRGTPFAPDGVSPRLNSGPPTGLVRATMLSQSQDYQAHGEPCASYGARMETAITNSQLDMTTYAFSSPSYALGTSNPSTGAIQISEYYDTAGNPLLNPRTNFEMSNTGFHESIHIQTGSYDESYINQQLNYCNGLTGYPQVPM